MNKCPKGPTPPRASALVAKRGEVPITANLSAVGLMAAAVVKVHYGSAYWRRRWHRLAKRCGVEWDREPVQSFGDKAWTATLEVWGSREAMADVLSVANDEVISWEYRMVTPGDTRTTMGQEKHPAPPAKSKPQPDLDLARQFAAIDACRPRGGTAVIAEMYGCKE